MKTCFKCKEQKPLEDFYKHPQMRDGHLNKCQECTKVDSSMRDPEKVRAYDSARAKTKERKEYAGLVQARIRKNHPEKTSAHNKLARAVKSGKIIKPDACSVCGTFTKIVGHHDDYSKPLDVIWVCDPCHKRIHVGIASRAKLSTPF